MKKVRWGILGTAKIAREKLAPAIKQANNAELVAIASRDPLAAQKFARDLELPLAFGSYEELLASDEVDAIYNPLPNHLHVPWSVKALEANKHVLCEKPLGLDVADAQRLQEAAAERPQLLVMEAFMYRFHPQWQKVRELIADDVLGEVKHIQSAFSFYNRDPNNVRNQPGIGGGGLMDIGCYCISSARLVFGQEPVRVNGHLILDPQFGVDVHATGHMVFPQGLATFHCSTQSSLGQLVHIIGDKGRLTLESPFIQPSDQPCEIALHINNEKQSVPVDVPRNQYVEQVEAFCAALLAGQPAPTPLADAICNMKVIDALVASNSSGKWVTLEV